MQENRLREESVIRSSVFCHQIDISPSIVVSVSRSQFCKWTLVVPLSGETLPSSLLFKMIKCAMSLWLPSHNQVTKSAEQTNTLLKALVTLTLSGNTKRIVSIVSYVDSRLIQSNLCNSWKVKFSLVCDFFKSPFACLKYRKIAQVMPDTPSQTSGVSANPIKSNEPKRYEKHVLSNWNHILASKIH